MRNYEKLSKVRVRFPPLPAWLASSVICFSSSTHSLSESSSSSWLLPGFHVSPRQFRDACSDAGVSRIAFLRHGQTAPATDNVDLNRQLTDQGRAQSQQAGASFGRSLLLPLHPTVLVSPAPRTMETAELFLEAAGLCATDGITLKPMASLYDGTMQPEGSLLFRKIGYAPLRDYVDATNVADRAVARRVLGEYTTTAANEIYQHLQGQALTPPPATAARPATPSTLLFVGHAIYLPAATLGVAVLCECPPQYQDLLLATNTLEAQGYVVHTDQPLVQLLTRDQKCL